MRSTGKDIEVKIDPSADGFSYHDEGPKNAPVIIFIHGLVLTKNMWSKQLEYFKDKYRVIAFDLQGHGKTKKGHSMLSIDLFADDLIHLMDILDIEKAIICGLSMGGYTSLRAINKYPERFAALILCDTQCIADTDEIKEKRKTSIEQIKQGGKREYAENFAKSIFLPESFSKIKKETDATLQSIIAMSDDAICDTLLALANREESCSKLGEIKVPTLIIVGAKDVLTPPERAKFMAGHISGAKMHIIENAAHMSNIENPADFNAYVSGFLRNALK